ncbi:putative GPI-anchored protein-like [Iris pallida]|uniref:GPI-anchored protein-like n=1 Tax=Iris pallida TaxID=29817 RepID=A0AAX6GHY6_IRIPA|nr:putative GPI-anchored protein-like [Iris pallida]
MGYRFSFFSFLILFLVHSATSDDTVDQLLKGINSYRTSLNLSTLTENQNAACLAKQIVNQFKDHRCINTTGSNTVPGTEQQFSNYPDFLEHCHLNATVTQDSPIMPACVPNLVPAELVLTKSQYSGSLNQSQFVGAGIADEGDWVVVVLSTNTPGGSFTLNDDTGFGSMVKVALHSLLLLVLGALFVLVN